MQVAEEERGGRGRLETDLVVAEEDDGFERLQDHLEQVPVQSGCRGVQEMDRLILSTLKLQLFFKLKLASSSESYPITKNRLNGNEQEETMAILMHLQARVKRWRVRLSILYFLPNDIDADSPQL